MGQDHNCQKMQWIKRFEKCLPQRYGVLLFQQHRKRFLFWCLLLVLSMFSFFDFERSPCWAGIGFLHFNFFFSPHCRNEAVPSYFPNDQRLAMMSVQYMSNLRDLKYRPSLRVLVIFQNDESYQMNWNRPFLLKMGCHRLMVLNQESLLVSFWTNSSFHYGNLAYLFLPHLKCKFRLWLEGIETPLFLKMNA